MVWGGDGGLRTAQRGLVRLSGKDRLTHDQRNRG